MPVGAALPLHTGGDRGGTLRLRGERDGTIFSLKRQGVDVETVSDAGFDVISDALFRHQVLVFKNQQGLSAAAQYCLTKRFDPASESYGHGKTIDAAQSILHPDLKTVPNQQQVQIIGHGHIDAYEGLTDFTLRHPHHRTFHRTAVPAADDLTHTRFYRWHLRVPLGATVFVSGYAMYDGLSDQDKAFACDTLVEYAPHPYVWISGARSRPDGLGLETEGRELDEADLPPVDPSKIKRLPLCWKNPDTGRLALQAHPSAVRALVAADGSRDGDLRSVRDTLHRLQRPGIAPERVYAHDWKEGDLVLFHNRGVLHSVVGAFADSEVRLFRQCNLAASSGVVGPDDKVY
ncbi:TfdA family taurine catabolism dioxygenase TauD [Zopfochytrium polystomum]|nr:TfdA family taurine catabolism dioxygenase TauD [Zopfochytrium polystomum]